MHPNGGDEGFVAEVIKIVVMRVSNLLEYGD